MGGKNARRCASYCQSSPTPCSFIQPFSFAAFPFALPLIVLLTLAAIPLLVVALLLAIVAAPVLLLRRLGSRALRRLRLEDHHEAAA